MVWIKSGVIFDPKKHINLPDPIAQLPCVLDLSDELIRVYFSYRESGCSLPAFFDFNICNLEVCTPIFFSTGLSQGKVGTFDEHGVMPSSLVRIDEKQVWMYYIGWSQGKTVPYRLSIGLAKSFDNGRTFKKNSSGPILSQSQDEIFYATCPHVQKIKEKWHMWYSSGEPWTQGKETLESRYIIKYRESQDGIIWSSPCIPFEQNTDVACAAPSFCEINNSNILLYSERNVLGFRHNKKASYRIRSMCITKKGGYERAFYDLDPSENGWDSEMTTYSQVFSKNNKIYMLYNGNQFGRTGIGLAEWMS